MTSPFPGMDPYLERKGLWSEVHAGLIFSIQRALTPLLRPNYRVAIERVNYSILLGNVEPIGSPDVIIYRKDTSQTSTGGVAIAERPTVEPRTAIIPMNYEYEQSFLEIREVKTQKVITVIEILSHANKQGRRGREQYEIKRDEILSSRTNLIEIDLLRAGHRPPMEIDDEDDYSILISRRRGRPLADVYLFSVRDAIPTIPIPLKHGEEEPLLDINGLLSDVYDAGGYDLAIDYSQPPTPRLDEEDATWAQAIINSQTDSS